MTAAALGLALLLQAMQTEPVLSFPEAGLDDPSAYQGYQTRFYRDSKRNAVQIYLDLLNMFLAILSLLGGRRR